MIDLASTFTPLLAATGFMLVDFIKPLLLLPGVIIYLRITSTYIEKDARYHNFGVNKVNLIMILGAIAAYAAGIFIPIFWVGFPVSLLVLAGLLYWYMGWRNKQVGESERFELVGDRIEQRRKAKESQRASKAVALKFIDPRVYLLSSPSVALVLIIFHALGQAVRSTLLFFLKAGGPRG